MVQKLPSQKPDHEKATEPTSNLLMINYYFPPVKAVGAIRVGNFYKHARKYFQKVRVITTSNQRIFQQEEEPPRYESINYIPTLDFRRLLSFFQKNVTYFSSRKKKHPVKQFIIKLIDSFPFNLLIGDGGLVYILMGYWKAKKMVKEEGITHLFSSFRPYSDHTIAFLLKLRYPQLYWIADFRDVQVDPNRKNVLLPRFQHWCNRQLLKRANLLTSVSKGYTAYLRRYNANTYCLNNGVESNQSPAALLKPFEKFTISYTGTVYPKLQNPGILFQALRSLIEEKMMEQEDLQVVLAGRDQEVWEEWLSKYDLQEILVSKGALSRSKALETQQRSHLNLLLSWSSPQLKGVLTGKLYEYLHASHPILSVINGTTDTEFEDLFEEFQAGLIAYNRKEELEKVKLFILDLYRTWKTTGQTHTMLQKHRLERLYWPQLMDQIMKECFENQQHDHEHLSTLSTPTRTNDA